MAWLRCASWNGASAHRCAQSATRSLPTSICTASRLPRKTIKTRNRVSLRARQQNGGWKFGWLMYVQFMAWHTIRLTNVATVVTDKYSLRCSVYIIYSYIVFTSHGNCACIVKTSNAASLSCYFCSLTSGSYPCIRLLLFKRTILNVAVFRATQNDTECCRLVWVEQKNKLGCCGMQLM